MSAMTKTERNLIALTVVLTVLAGVSRYVSGFGHIAAFIIAGLALAALAWVISFATDQMGAYFGSAVTGVLQAVVGNVPEFFVVLFALQARDVVVAQTALLGSILVNALLILGLVLMTGAYKAKDGVMRFGTQLPRDTATLLLSASFMIVLLGVANQEHAPSSHHSDAISVIGSVAMIIVYGIWMWRYLQTGGETNAAGSSAQATETDRPALADEVGSAAPAIAPVSADDPAEAPRLSKRTCVLMLLVAGAGAAFVSDWFVHSLEPTIHSLNISQAFAGLIIVAIAGNAVEHVVGIYLAFKEKNDLAISVVQNSVGQIAAFMYPLMVIVSLFTAGRLTFVLDPVYIAALIGTAVLIWQITGDGEATMFEGATLVGLFVVLATIALYQH
jgi:Ca2+:H+ antiporter